MKIGKRYVRMVHRVGVVAVCVSAFERAKHAGAKETPQGKRRSNLGGRSTIREEGGDAVRERADEQRRVGLADCGRGDR